ncbi:MAG: hypothetical protein ACFFBD_16200 [Candidatus Hodarchaeota archaeon]
MPIDRLPRLQKSLFKGNHPLLALRTNTELTREVIEAWYVVAQLGLEYERYAYRERE